MDPNSLSASGVRTAGLRILEARAQVGIAASGLFPQGQQLSGNALYVGTEQNIGRDRDFGLRLVDAYADAVRSRAALAS